jgi:hypothetical protein
VPVKLERGQFWPDALRPGLAIRPGSRSAHHTSDVHGVGQSDDCTGPPIARTTDAAR